MYCWAHCFNNKVKKTFMGNQQVDKNHKGATKKPNKFWLITSILFFLFFVFWLLPNIIFWIQYHGMAIAAWTRGFPPDCLWGGKAVAWIDENQNGQYDAHEQPLPGVVFHVSGGLDSTSNWKGETTLGVWLPGCPDAIFEISPEIPNGYRLTTAPNLPSNAREPDRVFEFGFITLHGVPTATARPPSPTCTSYRIGVVNQYEVSDMAIAADGSVWAATFSNGVVHYVSERDEWIRYAVDDGLISNDISSLTTLNNGDIWFAARGGATLWNGSQWLSYTDKDGLINNEVFKIAQAPDQSIWFATEGGVSHFIPDKGTWTNYTVNDGLADDFVRYVAVTPDNSVWFATFEGLTRLILPTSDGEEPKWVTYGEFIQEENHISLDYVDTIQVSPDGTYWFDGTDGLLQFDPKTETWKLDESLANIPGGISSITFGQDGSMWVAAGSEYPVVYHLNSENTWEIYDNRDGLPTISNVNEDDAVDVVVDFNNNVWIATRISATRCIFSENR
jgi:streptogramin lyase